VTHPLIFPIRHISSSNALYVYGIKKKQYNSQEQQVAQL